MKREKIDYYCYYSEMKFVVVVDFVDFGFHYYSFHLDLVVVVVVVLFLVSEKQDDLVSSMLLLEHL